MSTWWIINALLILAGACLAVYIYTHQTSGDDYVLLKFVGSLLLIVIGLISSGIKLLQ